MCYWPISRIVLEEPPPKKEKKEEKKPDYVLVSDRLNLQPITSPAPMNYPGQHSPQYYTTQPVPDYGHYQGGAARPKVVPQNASPTNQYWCRELDGTYTLRSTNEIIQNLQPGRWERSPSGYPYFIRAKP